MAKTGNDGRTPKKRSKKKEILFWVVIPLLILLLGSTIYGVLLYNKAQTVADESYKPIERKTVLREEKADPHIDNISILIAGIDDSESRNFSSASRTDALMLATFNEKQKTVKLLSIPRDSYVYIPAKGYEDKINHAYGKGGIASTIETVENFLGIPVDYYVKLNFNAFIDIVDALDGIEVDVPFAFSEQDSSDRQNAISLQPGLQELNGEQALALARTRHIDNDIERGKRQQQILKAVFDKAVSVKSITKYSDIIQAIGDNLETDLLFSEMTSLIDYATGGSGLEIESLTLAGSDSYIGGVYYYQLDEPALEEIKLKLSQHMETGDFAEGTSEDSMSDSQVLP
jgi:polyisoprenyl-teichoic acid--peptidoglycan teichoic acid transferase